MNGKVMSAEEAIGRFVHDGEQLVIGNYTVGRAELVYEVIRQGRKGLTLYSQSGIFDVETLVGAGGADRLVTTYCMRAGGKKGGSAVERALNAGTMGTGRLHKLPIQCAPGGGHARLFLHPGPGRSDGDRSFPEEKLHGGK